MSEAERTYADRFYREPADKEATVIEVMLYSWSDSPAGRKVTFLLPDDGEEHPFKHLKAGTKYGQRMALSVALIAEDETQEALSDTDEKEGDGVEWTSAGDRILRTEAQVAGFLCTQPSFQKFIEERYRHPAEVFRSQQTGPVPDADVAAYLLRGACQVSSRSELSTPGAAQDRWREIKADYDIWARGGP